MRHKRALITIGVAAGLDVAGGAAFAAADHINMMTGFYWSVTTATTVGYGDVEPHTIAARIIAVCVMLTVIPLFAATFSILTSSLTTHHVHAESRQTQRMISHIIKHHPDIPDLSEGE
jgi:voltage-gated potassium channel